jgi:ketosteroid isomerase-like protein
MKKPIAIVCVLLFTGATMFSQKKSGTVFSEHEAIGKTQEMWKAFVEGDEEAYRGFYADSAWILINDQREPKTANADIGKGIGWWKENYENFMIKDNKPAYPDALEYKDGGTWVQDWLLATGIHKESGIVLELPIHSIYAFDDEGKITLRISYFDNDIFEEINKSSRKIENGKIYISHPYIASVRKAMNAFVARDLETFKSFFTENARVSSLTQQIGDSMPLDEYTDYLAERYYQDDMKIKVEQVGYPDCMYYEESDGYVVYSWWEMKLMKGDKRIEFPFMLSHDFNKEGKIVRQNTYVSSNHLEKW